MSYTIGEVAKQLGLSVETIRYYDKAGLMPFVKRDSAGRRQFTANDLHLMEMVMCLKNAGVPVAEIATFVDLRAQGDASLATRYHLLEEHEQNLKTKLRICRTPWLIYNLKNGITKRRLQQGLRPFTMKQEPMRSIPISWTSI